MHRGDPSLGPFSICAIGPSWRGSRHRAEVVRAAGRRGWMTRGKTCLSKHVNTLLIISSAGDAGFVALAQAQGRCSSCSLVICTCTYSSGVWCTPHPALYPTAPAHSISHILYRYAVPSRSALPVLCTIHTPARRLSRRVDIKTLKQILFSTLLLLPSHPMSSDPTLVAHSGTTHASSRSHPNPLPLLPHIYHLIWCRCSCSHKLAPLLFHNIHAGGESN